jgi:hypothetical protein
MGASNPLQSRSPSAPDAAWQAANRRRRRIDDSPNPMGGSPDPELKGAAQSDRPGSRLEMSGSQSKTDFSPSSLDVVWFD